MDFSQQSQVEYECRLAGEGRILQQGAPHRPLPALAPVPAQSLRWGPQGKAFPLVLTGSPLAPMPCLQSQTWVKLLSLKQGHHGGPMA